MTMTVSTGLIGSWEGKVKNVASKGVGIAHLSREREVRSNVFNNNYYPVTCDNNLEYSTSMSNRIELTCFRDHLIIMVHSIIDTSNNTSLSQPYEHFFMKLQRILTKDT